MKQKRYLAKTFKGLELSLCKELEQMGIKSPKKLRRAVSFSCNKKELYKINYESRLALSILEPILDFNAKSEEELYKNVYQFNWSNIFNIHKTFSIVQVVNSNVFTHSKYASLKVKDAIVDKFRDQFGKRPNVDPKNPDIKIHLYINNTDVSISIDTSGDSLFKRGYREDTNEAPINEVLAAGMIALSKWDKKSTFIDPFCGSGTILIEAGMIASNMAPGMLRQRFGFENLKDFQPSLFQEVKEEALANLKEVDVKILGYEINPKNLRIAQKNLSNVPQLKSVIRLKIGDATDVAKPISNDKGIIITNPPYGERMHKEDVLDLYRHFGKNLKRNFNGFDVFMISPNKEAIDMIDIEQKSSIELMNGKLDCQFIYYKL